MGARVLVAGLLAFAFAAPAQLEESRRYFSLSSGETVLPGREVPVNIQSQGVDQLEFRLYRLKDPRAFFVKMGSTSSPRRKQGRLFAPRTPIERFDAWKRRQWRRLRDLARMQFSDENRARIRAWMQKKEKPAAPAEKAPSYAAAPLLNPDLLVKRWTQPIRPMTPLETVTIHVPLAEAGVYVLEATDQARQAYTVLVATPVGVIVKAYPGRAAVRVVDRVSGEPRSGCSLELLDVQQDRSYGKRTSNAEGAADFELRGSWEDELLLMAECGGIRAPAKVPAYAVAPRWGGVEGAIHTDRPVYRPGQKVHFRAIIRESVEGEFRKPEAGKVRIQVDDGEGNRVYQKTVSLTKYGTASGEFELPADAPLGYFGISVTPEGKEDGIYGGFHVEEYRKPEYEVRVHPAAKRALQGSRMEARIEARYYYGEPVAGAAVEWSLLRYRWFPPWWEWEEMEADSDAEELFGGEEVSSGEGRLDAEGRMEVAVPLERGQYDYQYRMVARVRDEGGRTIEGAGSFLGTRAPFLITARPDKWVYRRGETVRWRVNASDFEQRPVPAVTVRVEAYRETKGAARGSPVEARTAVTGADGEALVEFALPSSGAWILRTTARGGGAELREENWMWIAGEDSGWKPPERVRLALDRKSYAPGETALLTVITGMPRANVWLAVEGPTLYWSKFAMIEGGAGTVEIPVKAEFSPNVFINAVFLKNDQHYEGSKVLKVPAVDKQIFVSLEPSKNEFQPGEPASFRLTAKDRAGRPLRAEFALGVVDEAIYAIRREAQPDLMKVFYGYRWSRVETETNLSFSFWGAAGARRLELAGGSRRRFAAQLKREGMEMPKVRKNFPDTAFWVADLETDAQGRAEVRFEFPDSLTTWRATARGVTEDTKVGGAVERVLVRKDVVVSLAAPRFFTEGDETVVPVLARNYTDRPLRVRVGLQAQGVTVLEGRETELELAPGSEGKADYRLKAQQAGKATLTAAASGQGRGDALEITVPVHPYGIPMEASAQARLDGAGSRALVHEFPPAEESSGRVAEVRLSPSLGGALLGALEYLLEYPYGCSEQLMSGLLPNLAVAEAMRKLNLETAADRRTLERNVKAGLEKLYGQQNEDGGWGWWREDDSSLFLTSYVLLGLSHARDNGFPVRSYATDRAAGYLSGWLAGGSQIEADLLAYAFLAVARTGRATPEITDQVWLRRGDMSGFGWASLGLALQVLNDPRRRQAAERLAAMAQEDGEEVFWPSGRDVMFLHEAEHTFEATAMAARFLAIERPESGLAERAAQWLMNHRDRGYYWGSTKRTAFVIYGLIPLLERSGELKPDLTARVMAGGREVLTHRFTPADALASKPVKVMVPVSGARSEIRIETEGRGRLYASVVWRWRQTAAGDVRRLPEAGKLEVERRYYRLRRVESGGVIEHALEPWSGPARRGDIVAVRVSVRGASISRAFVVEDALPAGAEAVTRDAAIRLRGQPDWWRWWHARRELRDERASWFPWWIPDAGYETVYLFRFTNAGKFRAAPARVEAMYEPNVKAWSEAADWEVLP